MLTKKVTEVQQLDVPEETTASVNHIESKITLNYPEKKTEVGIAVPVLEVALPHYGYLTLLASEILGVPQEEPFFTIPQASVLLGLSPWVLPGMVKRGEIEATDTKKEGGIASIWKISLAEIVRFKTHGALDPNAEQGE